MGLQCNSLSLQCSCLHEASAQPWPHEEWRVFASASRKKKNKKQKRNNVNTMQASRLLLRQAHTDVAQCTSAVCAATGTRGNRWRPCHRWYQQPVTTAQGFSPPLPEQPGSYLLRTSLHRKGWSPSRVHSLEWPNRTAAAALTSSTWTILSSVKSSSKSSTSSSTSTSPAKTWTPASKRSTKTSKHIFSYITSCK